MKVEAIEGIGPVCAGKLAAAGVGKTDDPLAQERCPDGSGACRPRR